MENLHVTGENHLETWKLHAYQGVVNWTQANFFQLITQVFRIQLVFAKNNFPNVSGNGETIPFRKKKTIHHLFLFHPSPCETASRPVTPGCERTQQEVGSKGGVFAKGLPVKRDICWVTPPRMPVANEGLVSGSPILKIVRILVVTGILGRGTTQDIRFRIFMKPLCFDKRTAIGFKDRSEKNNSRTWWHHFENNGCFSHICIFIPNLGQMIQFDEYVSNGLNQTTN